MIDKMVNWTDNRQVSKSRKIVKRHTSPKYGYYMLLITPAPDVRDHLSDREISTVLFLPAQIMSKAGELPRRHKGVRPTHLTTGQFSEMCGHYISSALMRN
jgi:hypothetical protein